MVRVSLNELDHKKETQLVLYTQRLKSYPHAIVRKAGSSPGIYISSIVIAFEREGVHRIMYILYVILFIRKPVSE
jgi:hypothetical protein